MDYLGESTVGNLHFVERGPRRDGAAVLGLANMEDLYDATQDQLETATSALLGNLGLQSFQYPEGRPERAIFCRSGLGTQLCRCTRLACLSFLLLHSLLEQVTRVVGVGPKLIHAVLMQSNTKFARHPDNRL